MPQLTSVLSPVRQPGDDANPLRPLDLRRFVGQPHLRERVSILIESAQQRGEPCEHLLLAGPPGLGKTTLAGIIATAMGGPLIVTSGPALQRPYEILETALMMEPNTVFFIDEIHGLPRLVEEALYPAMEDRQIDLFGPARRESAAIGGPRRTSIQPFTLIGATTQAGRLSAPLRDRFGVNLTFAFYPPADLASIILQSAAVLGVTVEDQAALILARAARGTPRIANRLLRRVRDYALVRAGGYVSAAVTQRALAIEGIDNYGLDEQDRSYLQVLCDFYSGGPAGVAALAASMQLDRDTLADVIEPYLLHNGLIIRTPSGRRVTANGIRVLQGRPGLQLLQNP